MKITMFRLVIVLMTVCLSNVSAKEVDLTKFSVSKPSWIHGTLAPTDDGVKMDITTKPGQHNWAYMRFEVEPSITRNCNYVKITYRAEIPLRMKMVVLLYENPYYYDLAIPKGEPGKWKSLMIPLELFSLSDWINKVDENYQVDADRLSRFEIGIIGGKALKASEKVSIELKHAEFIYIDKVEK